ncbi:MAG: ribosomal protein S18-alanine N-acetyltransferase [Marinobacterium sp.]|nr:ribosomal protein S18-alanine N-acetyltransferase [Marinobacterium sp.]
MSELIEPLTQAVLPGLQRLQKACFGEAWSEDTWLNQMRSPRTRLWGPGDPMLGYALFNVVLDEAELLQIAIDPPVQGRKLGQQLLEQSMVWLAEEGVSRVLLEVRASNAPAIAMYTRLGFERDCIRKDYYPTASYPTATGREDALLMSVAISP